MTEFKLYSYFRSSSAYRVRIALNLKGIDYEYIPVHLVKDGGEQHKEDYTKLNPSRQVPLLLHGDKIISQSMAIIQYIDDITSGPELFPVDPYEKAKVIQLSEMVNSNIQPIQNLQVLQEITNRFGVDQEGKADWARHWITRGFVALEQALEKTAGKFCLGDSVSAADLYLVPQVYNARRFKVDMSAFATIEKIDNNCLQLEAFQKAKPSVQPDAPADV